MRVLQLIPGLRCGGAETFVCELSVKLNSYEHVDCDIATMYPIDEGCNYGTKLKGVRVCSLGKGTGFSLRYIWRLFKFIKDNKYDVVHAHLNTIPYLILPTLLLRRTKFVATIHSDAYFEAPSKISRLVRRFLFATHIVTPVTISEESARSFKECYGLDSTMIYNGVSTYKQEHLKEFHSRKDGEQVFVHPASCQPVKNQELLLKTFDVICKRYPNVYLYWFGDNTTYRKLFDEQLSGYLSDRIRYCGCVQNLRDYLFQADAMCLSSLIEGMPMVIIESFSVSCVPLTTPAGGCVNLIQNGVNGFVSDSFEQIDYYGMIERFILMSDAERNEMRRNAFESFKRYSIDLCAEHYLTTYNH